MNILKPRPGNRAYFRHPVCVGHTCARNCCGNHSLLTSIAGRLILSCFLRAGIMARCHASRGVAPLDWVVLLLVAALVTLVITSGNDAPFLLPLLAAVYCGISLLWSGIKGCIQCFLVLNR